MTPEEQTIISLKDSNQTFLVEAIIHEGPQAARIEAAAAPEAAEKSLKSALASIREIANSVAKLAIPENVDEAEVEIGFQFDASGTIYVVSTTAKASIKLKLKLKRPSPSGSQNARV